MHWNSWIIRIGNSFCNYLEYVKPSRSRCWLISVFNSSKTITIRMICRAKYNLICNRESINKGLRISKTNLMINSKNNLWYRKNSTPKMHRLETHRRYNPKYILKDINDIHTYSARRGRLTGHIFRRVRRWKRRLMI